MHSMKRLLALASVLASFAAMVGSPVNAQTYPSKPIRLVVPYAPGGNSDVLARVAAQKLSDVIGEPVVIDNRPGAFTLLGIRAALAAAPDGYTLLLANSTTAALPYITRTPAGFTLDDIRPVGPIGTVPMVLDVPASLPVKTVADLVAYDKANPGILNIGQIGGQTTLLAERLKHLTGVKMVDINYPGAAQALSAVSAGQIHLFIDGAPTSIPLHKADRIRIIGVASDKRLAALPDVPTFKEQGLPAMSASAWYSVAVSAKVPEAVYRKLAAALAQALADPEVKERMKAAGGEAWSGSLADFESYIRTDAKAMEEDAQRSGYKLP
jgi:tripartite-type tricarboxylate transporter receptor subunit TctC